MDEDKEKPVPAPKKLNSFAITNDNDDPNNSHDTTDDKDNLPPPESTTTAADEGDENHDKNDVDQTPEEGDRDQIKEEGEEEKSDEISVLKVEEPSPLPPDLGKVSEEIDQYMSTMFDDESLHSDVHVPIFVEQFAVLVEAKIEDYDGESPVKWTDLKDEEAECFLEALTRISKLSISLNKFSSDFKFAYSINRIGGVLQRGMSYLEEEFKLLLEDHRIFDPETESKPPPPNSVSEQEGEGEECSVPESDPPEEDKITEYPEEILSNLKKLAKCMILGGHETECRRVYFMTRRTAMEESLLKMGFEKHSIDDVQKMHWESLEREIMTWIKVFKQCMDVQFPAERKLCDAVFSDKPSISATLSSHLCRGAIIQLLNVPEAVAMTKRAAEKLFKFLDVYETLRDAIPAMDKLFVPRTVVEIKSETTLIKSRFGEAMVIIFCELENSIKADSAKTPVPGGAVHPLTRYTMNYLKYACEYKDTLEQVFREHKKIERADSGIGSDFDYNSSQVQDQNVAETESPFQVQLTKVMDLLDANLEAKSKLYKDQSLNSIFMMNNGRYILKKVRGSPEINSLMGDPWCRKRSSELRTYHKNYQRETWGRLVQCLMNHDGLTVNGKVVKPVLKERFKNFNAIFDEIHKTQSSWVVADDQLQSELRVSISNMVIPAYRAFLARYGQTLTPGRQTEKYVKYQPEDIETYIDDLFDGNAAASAGRRKS